MKKKVLINADNINNKETGYHLKMLSLFSNIGVKMNEGLSNYYEMIIKYIERLEYDKMEFDIISTKEIYKNKSYKKILDAVIKNKNKKGFHIPIDSEEDLKLFKYSEIFCFHFDGVELTHSIIKLSDSIQGYIGINLNLLTESKNK